MAGFTKQDIQSLREIIREEMSDLKSDVAEIKVDVAELKTDVAALKVDVAELKVDVAALKVDVAGNKADIAGLKGDVAQNRILLEQAADDRQKMLEMISTVNQQINKTSNIHSQVEIHEDKIHVNKTVLKHHISDDTIHLPN